MSLTIQRDTARAALTDCVSDFNYLARKTADEGLKTWLLDRSRSMQATIDIIDADSAPAATTIIKVEPDPYTKADSADCLEQQANAWRHVADALHAAFPQWHKLKDTGKEAAVEAIRLIGEKAAKYDAINTPEIDDFLTAVHNEALHQRERWGSEHDAGKTDADWFWLVGYLAGKAIGKGVTEEKQVHHIITTAAALLNWHAHKTGASTAMRPGIGPDAQPPKPAHFNEVTLNDGGAA